MGLATKSTSPVPGDYMQKFYGMNELCEDGCNYCEYIVDRCQEYGPLQLRVLLSDTRRHFKSCTHFDRWVLAERVCNALGTCTTAPNCFRDLVNYAMKLSECSETREECLELSQQMFDSNVSCDNLVYFICEKKYFWDEFQDKRVSCPWELVQTMLKNWNVKTVCLRLASFYESVSRSSEELTDIGYFTNFNWQFPRDNEPQLVSEVRLQNVRINLDNSHTLDFHIFALCGSGEICENFLSATRRMFPSKRYQIVQRFDSSNIDPIENIINESYNFIWKDDPTNLNLDIAMFTDEGFSDKFSSAKKDNPHLIRSYFGNRQLTVTEIEWSERVAQFPPDYPRESFGTWPGHCIRVTDPIANCVINYDVCYALFD